MSKSAVCCLVVWILAVFSLWSTPVTWWSYCRMQVASCDWIIFSSESVNCLMSVSKWKSCAFFAFWQQWQHRESRLRAWARDRRSTAARRGLWPEVLLLIWFLQCLVVCVNCRFYFKFQFIQFRIVVRSHRTVGSRLVRRLSFKFAVSFSLFQAQPL